MATIIPLEDERATDRLAAALIQKLSPGDIVLLTGELGAGKTRFVRGVAAALDAQDQVSSPTFALLNIYETRLWPVYHFDLYRLSGEDAFIDAGLEEMLDMGGVSFIEWPERAWELLRKRAALIIQISGQEGQTRKAALTGRLEDVSL